MKKSRWNSLQLVLMLGVLVIVFGFASYRNAAREIAGVKIQIEPAETPFINKEIVNNLLIEKMGGKLGVRKDKLDLNKLEKSIDTHPMIAKSEVSVGVDGLITVKIRQKKPVARVVDASGSFYIDTHGSQMPLSKDYTERVPLLTGWEYFKQEKDAIEVLLAIQRDPFLQKNITAMHMGPEGMIVLENRLYDYAIDFGKALRIEQKLANYKAFYQRASQDSLLAQYKRINLTFSQQVVCTK